MFISGAGTGLGRAYAEHLVSQGACVIINDIAMDSNGNYASVTAADEIQKAGGNAVADHTDITDRVAIRQALNQYIDKFGKIDICIHNAGATHFEAFDQLSDETWDKTLDVHLNAANNILKPIITVMKNNGYGRILLISSSVGMFGTARSAPYAAAKMAIWGLVKSLHVEFSSQGIFVNAISPIAKSSHNNPLFIEKMDIDFDPNYIAPFVSYLCSRLCLSSGNVFVCGGGYFALSELYESEGIYLDKTSISLENISNAFKQICDMKNAIGIFSFEQAAKKLLKKIFKGA